MNEFEFFQLPRIWESPLSERWTLPPRPAIVGAAPIILDGGQFQLHPDPSTAPERAWRPIVAIRIGSPSWPDDHCATAGEIVDFAALSPAADRVIATLYGYADVMGHPPNELFTAARIGRTDIYLRTAPSNWLKDLRGAVLVRPVHQSILFLRQFETVIVDEIDYGTMIERALRRAYRGPQVRVVASRSAAS